MKRVRESGFAFAGVMLLSATAWAGEKPQEKPGGGPSGDDPMAAMMAELMKYATPGEHHQYLEPLAGTWKLSSKFRQVPEGPWSESAGEAVIEWILGNRFLQQRVKTPATQEFPMDFEGFGLLGYDNLAGKYLSIWMDNLMTGAMIFHGISDASGKVITLSGEFANPMKGGELTSARWVYKIINENKFVFEMWEPDEHGKDFLHGEITYTRVK